VAAELAKRLAAGGMSKRMALVIDNNAMAQGIGGGIRHCADLLDHMACYANLEGVAEILTRKTPTLRCRGAGAFKNKRIQWLACKFVRLNYLG